MSERYVALTDKGLEELRIMCSNGTGTAKKRAYGYTREAIIRHRTLHEFEVAGLDEQAAEERKRLTRVIQRRDYLAENGYVFEMPKVEGQNGGLTCGTPWCTIR